MEKQSNVKNIWRGIDKEFSQAFKESELFKLYQEHMDELIIGVRNNYLNLYYNCDSIAKIEYLKRTKELKCEIANHYLGEGIGRRIIKPIELCDRYDEITNRMDEDKTRSTQEKKAQSKLVLLNNLNKKSNWYCIDVEYLKQFNNNNERKEAEFFGRFDIIALSKSKPHKLAIIELKYGEKAIGGKIGIYKHIKDFHTFVEKEYFESHLLFEVIEIVRSLKELNIPVPFETPVITNILAPEFYVITLDNRKDGNKRTPKQKMAAYLFNEPRWNCTQQASKEYIVESKFGDVTNTNNRTMSGKKFNVTFLFSTQQLENLKIYDIINDYNNDDKVLPQ
jgi:hypothetical protein